MTASSIAIRPFPAHRPPRTEPSRHLLELTTLYEISKLLGASVEMEQPLAGALRILESFLGLRRGTVLLADPVTEELATRVAHGMTQEEIARGRYRRGEGILGRVFEHGVPMVIPDIGAEPLFLDRTRPHGSLTAKRLSLIAVPIKAGGATIGVLSGDRPVGPDTSFEQDVRILTIVASLIGHSVNLHRHLAREREGLLEQTRGLQQALRSRFRLDNVVGQGKRMREIFEAVGRAADSRATILLRGESGTGKELIAHAVHFNSPRAAGPFIRVNCAALPHNLLESELFGHEKGAFTGATAAKKGRFELADGGSLFLDEIGDLPSDLQVKLLRVLQERCFERVGGTRTVRVDVRIIAATHRDLEAAVASGDFREDLYYRLNVVPIILPPLRQRREDIPLLVEHFLAKFNRENNRKVRITGRALQLLMAYDWPGNVRELENGVERLVIMARRRLILPEDLPFPVRLDPAAPPRASDPPARPAEAAGATRNLHSLRELEREQVLAALTRANGIQAEAARLLGITPRQLAYRLKRHAIRRTYQTAEGRAQPLEKPRRP